MQVKRILGLLLIMGLTAGLWGCSASKTKPQPNQPAAPPSSETPAEPDARTDSGTYVGRIDRNSIEIKISGLPDQEELRAFQLSKSLIEGWDDLGLKEGEQIQFQYVERQDDRPLIVGAKKL